MKPLAAEELRGTWGTLLLQLNDDESIDYQRLSLQIDALIRFQVDAC